MKKLLLLFCTLIASLCGVAQQADSTIVYADSVTGACIVLPSDAQIKAFDMATFCKFTATFPHSMLSFYSMKNEKDEPFTWDAINKFDKDNRFGTDPPNPELRIGRSG